MARRTSTGSRRSRLRLAAVVAAVAVGIVAAIAGGAFADQVANNLDTTIDSTPETMALTVGGANGSVGYILNATNGDAKSGCNLTGAGSQLVVDLSSSDTTVATVGSSQITISACNSTAVAVSVHPVGAGSASITAAFHSVTSSSSVTSADFAMATATFTVNVSNPTPTNHAPSTPGNPTVASGTSPRADGNFTVNWTASTDQDSGDTVSYTLEQHDASTSTWSPVASGLSTNSYTFGGSNAAETEGTWSYRVKATDNHGLDSVGYGSSSDLVKVDESNPNSPTVSSPTSAAYNDGSSDWYKDSVTVSFAANGDPALADTSAGSGVASVTSSQTFDSSNVNATTGAFSLTGYATDNVGNQSSSGTTVSGKVDWQAPTVSITPTTASVYTNGSGEWWKDSVSLTVAASDPAPSSGLATDPSTSLGPFTTSGSVAASTYTAEDNVGHSTSNTAFTYNVDSAAPTFGACTGGPFLFNTGTHNVSITAQDEAGGSGLDTADSTLTGMVSTGTAGDHTVTFTAQDNVGHTSTKTCHYNVNYNFIGFLSPLNPDPTYVNTGNAGRTYPIKWQLTDGATPPNYITDAVPNTTIAVSKINCSTISTDTGDPIDYTASGGTSLRYDSTANQYVYNWATPSTKNSCYRLTVTTPDGQPHVALFSLK